MAIAVVDLEPNLEQNGFTVSPFSGYVSVAMR